MRTWISLVILLLMCGSAWGAELLVQAKDSPFETGAKIGDIIVVRPDGWKWGRAECLPSYVVIKLPNVKVEDVKHYEEQLTELVEVDNKGDISLPAYKPEMVRLRKYAIPASEVTALKASKTSVKTVKEESVAEYTIATKELAIEKAAIAEAESLKSEGTIEK